LPDANAFVLLPLRASSAACSRHKDVRVVASTTNEESVQSAGAGSRGKLGARTAGSCKLRAKFKSLQLTTALTAPTTTCIIAVP
jgi:hypothetical protein